MIYIYQEPTDDDPEDFETVRSFTAKRSACAFAEKRLSGRMWYYAVTVNKLLGSARLQSRLRVIAEWRSGGRVVGRICT